MAISPDKKSIAVTVTKKVYAELKKIASKNKRSISYTANACIEFGLSQEVK